jgi:flagellar hook assembly protein FlgD
MIEYQLPQAVAVEITIFNVQGQKVTSLVNDVRPAGSHKITWNGLSETGQPVASGIYLYHW